MWSICLHKNKKIHVLFNYLFRNRICHCFLFNICYFLFFFVKSLPSFLFSSGFLIFQGDIKGIFKGIMGKFPHIKNNFWEGAMWNPHFFLFKILLSEYPSLRSMDGSRKNYFELSYHWDHRRGWLKSPLFLFMNLIQVKINF